MTDKLRTFSTLVVLGTLALLLVLPGEIALAGGGSARSCMGFEASEISPPGSSSEIPGGAPALGQAIGEIASALGVAPGRVYAFIASLHEGSHEACDEALE